MTAMHVLSTCRNMGISHVPLMDGDTPHGNEQALWKAVITQALMDAGSNSRKVEAMQEKEAAIRWLLGASEDFTAVCLHAGMDPGYVRRKAMEAIARGCSWRKGMNRPSPVPLPAHNDDTFSRRLPLHSHQLHVTLACAF